MSESKFDNFMKLHRQMLDCYSKVEVNDYKNFNGI